MTYNSIKSVQVKFIIREEKFDSIEKDIEINIKYIESRRYQVCNYNSEETEAGRLQAGVKPGVECKHPSSKTKENNERFALLSIISSFFYFFSNDTMSCTYILVKQHFEHTLHFLHPIFS